MLIFPDIEKILVAYFKDVLDPEIRVATKYAQPDETMPDKQVIIIGAYNQETPDRVTKLASVTIEVYADDYTDASQLGLLVEALSRNATIDGIKRVEVRVGPVRTSEESTFERRSLDLEIVVQGHQA